MRKREILVSFTEEELGTLRRAILFKKTHLLLEALDKGKPPRCALRDALQKLYDRLDQITELLEVEG